MNELTNEWMCEWMSGYIRMSKWVCEWASWVSASERVSKWVSEWLFDWLTCW